MRLKSSDYLLRLDAIPALVKNNKIFTLFDQGLLGFYGFVYVLLIVRPLSKEEFGAFMLADSFKFFIFALVDGSVSQSLIKYLAGADDSEKPAILTTCLVLKVSLLALITVLIFPLVNPLASLFNTPVLPMLLLLISPTVAGKIIYNSSRAILISRQEFDRLFYLHLTHAVIFLGGIILGSYYFRIDSALQVMLIFLYANFLSSILSFFFIKGRWKLGRFDLKWLSLIYQYSQSAFINTTGSWLYWKTDILMLGAFIGPAAAGIYGICGHFMKAFTLLMESFHLALFPAVSELSGNKNDIVDETRNRLKHLLLKYGIYLQIITAFSSVFIILIAKPLIILLFTNKFAPAVPALQILLIGIILTPFSRLSGSIFSGLGKPHISAAITWITGIINVILNLIMIPAIGMVGAAAASTISALSMTILYAFILRKYKIV